MTSDFLCSVFYQQSEIQNTIEKKLNLLWNSSQLCSVHSLHVRSGDMREVTLVFRAIGQFNQREHCSRHTHACRATVRRRLLTEEKHDAESNLLEQPFSNSAYKRNVSLRNCVSNTLNSNTITASQ